MPHPPVTAQCIAPVAWRGMDHHVAGLHHDVALVDQLIDDRTDREVEHEEARVVESGEIVL